MTKRGAEEIQATAYINECIPLVLYENKIKFSREPNEVALNILCGGPVSLIPDSIEIVLGKNDKMTLSSIRALKYKLPFYFDTSSSLPHNGNFQLLKDWAYWSTILLACRSYSEDSADDVNPSIIDKAYLLFSHALNCIYDSKDFAVEWSSEMPLQQTKHVYTNVKCPLVAFGFSKTNIPPTTQGMTSTPSVGSAYLPFIICSSYSGSLEKARTELGLQLQRALDYQIEYFGNDPQRIVVGVLLEENQVLAWFFTMTKSSEKYEMNRIDTFQISEFGSWAQACQIVCNAKKIARGIKIIPPQMQTTIENITVSRFHSTDDPLLPPYDFEFKKPISNNNRTPIYKGVDKRTGAKVVLKTGCFFKNEIPSEAKYTELLGGKHHTCKILDHFLMPPLWKNETDLRDVKYKVYAMIFEFIEHGDPTSLAAVKQYMKHLLQALAHCHNNQLIHRDVKQGNVLRDIHTGNVTLIDFGSADMSGQHKYTYEGTESYHPPEMHEEGSLCTVSFAGDIWSAGVVFLELMLGDEETYVEEREYEDVLQILSKMKKSFAKEKEKYLNEHPLVSEHGIELVGEMLQVNRWKRISAQTALGHPYFYD